MRIEPFDKFADVDEKRNYIHDSAVKLIDKYGVFESIDSRVFISAYCIFLVCNLQYEN